MLVTTAAIYCHPNDVSVEVCLRVPFWCESTLTCAAFSLSRSFTEILPSALGLGCIRVDAILVYVLFNLSKLASYLKESATYIQVSNRLISTVIMMLLIMWDLLALCSHF